jgi:hypothetical protein
LIIIIKRSMSLATVLAAVIRTRPGADSNFQVGQLLLIAFVYSDIELVPWFAIDKCRKCP